MHFVLSVNVPLLFAIKQMHFVLCINVPLMFAIKQRLLSTKHTWSKSHTTGIRCGVYRPNPDSFTENYIDARHRNAVSTCAEKVTTIPASAQPSFPQIRTTFNGIHDPPPSPLSPRVAIFGQCGLLSTKKMSEFPRVNLPCHHHVEVTKTFHCVTSRYRYLSGLASAGEGPPRALRPGETGTPHS